MSDSESVLSSDRLGRSWLRQCATWRNVAVWIIDGVMEIFHCHNTSGSPEALLSAHALNRNEYLGYFLGRKSGRCSSL